MISGNCRERGPIDASRLETLCNIGPLLAETLFMCPASLPPQSCRILLCAPGQDSAPPGSRYRGAPGRPTRTRARWRPSRPAARSPKIRWQEVCASRACRRADGPAFQLSVPSRVLLDLERQWRRLLQPALFMNALQSRVRCCDGPIGGRARRSLFFAPWTSARDSTISPRTVMNNAG